MTAPAREKAHAHVSVAQLAKETALSERSIRRAIAGLEARGILSRQGRDEWVIHVDVLETLPRVGDVDGC